MARNVIPTYTTNQLITASHANTYWKDNEAAHWPYTTAGDIAVASSSSVLSRLALGDAYDALMVNSAGTGIEWSSGIGVQDAQTVYVTPDQTFTSSSYDDVTGATVTLTLKSTCRILVLANVMGYVNSTSAGFTFSYICSVGGTDDTATIGSGSENPQRNQEVGYHYLKTGVAAGSVIVKLRCKEPANGTDNYITSARLTAFAIAE